MAAKEMSCPHCKKILPFGSFVHDEKLNFICCYCSKPIFGVTEEAETELKKHHGITSGYSASNGWKKEPLPIQIASSPPLEEEATVEQSETTSSDPQDAINAEEFALYC
jgi:hypothetical protein